MAKTRNRNQQAMNTYEESRKQRLQDNLKRFEDLGILKISKSLLEVTNSGKKSPQCTAKPRLKRSIEMLELRRSSRARNLVSSYSDAPDIGLPTPRKRSRTSSSWKSYLGRPASEVKFASDEERASAIHNAEILQSNLGSKNPSFIKSMVRSHVYSCFWLGLPSKFCKDHLPLKEVNMVLEDENGSEYDAIYIGSRQGLSGGWRGFALDHKLDDGDALVFELSEPTRFKIYILRAFIDNKNDGENMKQKVKVEKAVDIEADEGIISQKQQKNVGFDGISKVQKGKKSDNGNRAASKNRKQKNGVNSESEVNNVIIEAEVQKEKVVEKAKRSASPKQQQKTGVSGKSKVKQGKIAENGDGCVSLKPQQQDEGNKLSTKRCMPTKLFRRKVY